MNFKIRHTNVNVQHLEPAIQFYEDALGLKVTRRKEKEDGSFILVYLSDDDGLYEIELTWLRDHQVRPYDLGENESHICFAVDDYKAAYDLHKKLDVICYENNAMGLYFIEDPDGYWIEIVPAKR